MSGRQWQWLIVLFADWVREGNAVDRYQFNWKTREWEITENVTGNENTKKLTIDAFSLWVASYGWWLWVIVPIVDYRREGSIVDGQQFDWLTDGVRNLGNDEKSNNKTQTTSPLLPAHCKWWVVDSGIEWLFPLWTAGGGRCNRWIAIYWKKVNRRTEK